MQVLGMFCKVARELLAGFYGRLVVVRLIGVAMQSLRYSSGF